LLALASECSEKPRQSSDAVRVDLHLHSNYSHDGQSSLEELIQRCAECGLGRIALTDHNTVEGALILAEMAPELTIVGEEAKTREGEVIGLFITSRLLPYQRAEDVMDMIHGMGGLTYIPHPLDRNRAHFRAERIVELADRIDIIETYNAWCEPAANQAAARLAEDLGKVSATGSDSHSASELGRSWMEVEDFTSPQDFLDKLRYARHVVTARSGTGRRA
jgi:predicted metal-dependent phosphoesterase TrpH